MRTATEIQDELDQTRLRKAELLAKKLSIEGEIKQAETKYSSSGAAADFTSLHEIRLKLSTTVDAIRSFADREVQLIQELGTAAAGDSAVASVFDAIREKVGAAPAEKRDIDQVFGLPRSTGPSSNMANLQKERQEGRS